MRPAAIGGGLLRHVWPAAFLLVALLAACGAAEGGALAVTSPDMQDGAPLGEPFTCIGENAAPTLTWSGGPVGVDGWAVVVDGPDAPTGTFTHWVVTGLGPSTRSVGAQLPAGAVAGLTSSGQAGYVGPCPPSGQEHRFRFRVHALGEPLLLDDKTPVATARQRIEALSLDAAEIEVTYRAI
ncbi:MAG: YbhB/YbcL family Raf kinase inhibitor-like protein [Acidimicrobiales bacterium]